MPQIARAYDFTGGFGMLKSSGCAQTVKADFMKVALVGCPVTEHMPWTPVPLHVPHKFAFVLTPSPTVWAEFRPVVKAGSSCTCGHSVMPSISTVIVP